MKAKFDEIYEQYHQDIYQFIFYMVKNKEETEDILQEVYIRVFQSYHTFNHKSSEKTWIFSIARHVTYDYFRKLKRKRKRVLDFFNWTENGEVMPNLDRTPEEVSVLSDEINQLYQCLEGCTYDQKQVILLRYLQQFSIKETAKILGWTDSKVKTTQHRAIKVLEQCMHLNEEREVDNIEQ